MPPTCFDNMEIEDLNSCTNSEVQSGISETGVYYAPHAHATTIPMPLAPGDPGYTYEKATTVSTPIVFQAGKGFGKIDVQVDTGEVKVTAGGNKGNKTTKQTFEFMLKGSDERNLGFLRTHLNTPMIWIVTDRNGKKRQLGDAINPAYLSEGESTTGKTGEDDNGISFTIETYGKTIFYKSTLQMFTPAEPETP